MNTVLVVGADRGIAYAIAIQLAARGDRVFAACKEDNPELRRRGATVYENIDVTSDAAVSRMADDLRAKNIGLDIVFHVAGILLPDKFGSIDLENVYRQFEVNALGPLRVIQAVRDRFASGTKVGIATSRVGSLSDNRSGGEYGYRMSKAAANMLGLNLHMDLRKAGIAFILLHPGAVATDLTSAFPKTPEHISPELAAERLIQRMDELTLESADVFRHANGELLPW